MLKEGLGLFTLPFFSREMHSGTSCEIKNYFAKIFSVIFISCLNLLLPSIRLHFTENLKRCSAYNLQHVTKMSHCVGFQLAGCCKGSLQTKQTLELWCLKLCRSLWRRREEESDGAGGWD